MAATTRLLLIDEDDEARNRIVGELTGEQTDVALFACESMDKGLQALSSDGIFDCVLVDFSRPDSAGLEFIALAAAQSVTLPVVMLTGECTGRGVEALRAGAEDYLVKCDLKPGELLRAIRHAIVRHRIRTEQESREALLRVLCFCDPLTGVLNRRGLEDACSSLSACQRVSALLVDCDDFKSVNSRYGHAAGDRALCGMSKLLRAGLREGDHVARVGGDEFIVLLPDTLLEDAIRIAERTQHRIARGDGNAPAVTVSIGVAEVPSDARTATAILECTQRALSNSKRLGKNRVSALWPDGSSAYRCFDQRDRDLSRLMQALPPEPAQALEVLGRAIDRISIRRERSAG